jgi:hypothetical protein
MTDAKTPENTPAPDPNVPTPAPVAPVIDPTDVPDMTNKDINAVSGDGLKKDASQQQADMAEGLKQARDQANGKDAPEVNPFAGGPGGMIS